jgi:carbon storage regulator CsrA
MLIFTRRIGQTIKIGEDIALTVLAIDREEVRIRVNVAKIWLLLTCSIGQPLNIGSDVTITVLVISQSKIRMGIEAAADTPVYRLERGDRPGLALEKATQT